MAIPDVDENGFLPEGIHDCTLDEVLDRFGRFQESDRRPILARQLAEYLEDLLSAGVGSSLVVNGSFVTGKPQPGDIDLLLLLRDDVDLAGPLPPFRYNGFSKKYVRNKYDFDFYVGFERDKSSEEILSLFRKIKNQPGSVKGYLRIRL